MWGCGAQEYLEYFWQDILCDFRPPPNIFFELKASIPLCISLIYVFGIIISEPNFIFSKSKNAAAYSLDEGINIAEHSYKSTDIQVPIIFGYKILGPISVFAGPSFKYSLSNSSNFDLEEIKDKYTLSLLIGSRVKFRSLSLGLRYERGLNNKEILIINANGVELDNANVDLTTNKLSLNLSYDIPYGLFKKKNN